MKILGIIKTSLLRNRHYFGYLGLLVLFLLGLMNVIYVLGFRQPTDGVIWNRHEDSVTPVVDSFVLDEAQEIFQPADKLLAINDEPFDFDQYRDFIGQASIGVQYLYEVEREGDIFAYWVTIRGLVVPSHRGFFPFAVTGIFYLAFLLLSRNQKSSYSRFLMTVFCLSVYMDFAFYHTNRFALLDWIAYILDGVSNLLLPSALAALIISQVLRGSRWLSFSQALHWAPTLLLLLLLPLLLLQYVFQQDARINADNMQEILSALYAVQAYWGAGLIGAAVLFGAVVGVLRQGRLGFAPVWALAWLPYAIFKINPDLTLVSTIAAFAPILLPITWLYAWSRSGEMYLGDVGRGIGVYSIVVLGLLFGYALFIISFQALLGEKISSAAHETVLGIGIMFAAISYAPAKQWAAALIDRLIYGKRLESIRSLSDFSEMNRADIRIEDFLAAISKRLRAAFNLDAVTIYQSAESPRIYRSLARSGENKVLIFADEVPRPLQEGQIIRGHQAQLDLPDSQEKPLNPNDFLCPIRISERPAILLVFSLEGNNPRLNPEEGRMLRSLLHQCEIVMENIDLYQAVTQKALSINQLKEYNDNIIESSRIGILTTDALDRAVSCNSALAELAAKPKSEIMGLTFDQIFAGMSVARDRQVRYGWLAEGRYENENGQLVTLEIQRNPLKTKENEVYGTLYLMEDVTEKKAFSDKLMQQEKLASIGLLAAGVAHEINTPLTGITSYAQLMGMDKDLDEDKRELLQLIQAQSRRAAHIVSELLNFSRKESLPKGPVSLAEVLDQTLRFLSHQITKKGVHVALHESEQPPMIEGYGNQIQQVFVNLIVNAMDAMPDGGDLDIHTLVNRRHVIMSFKDTGVGMDESVAAKIFDPFFTTKEVGKGTGLGLAVVYNILHAHGAQADVRSAPGRGCDFRLTFPRLLDGKGPEVVAEPVTAAQNLLDPSPPAG